MSFLQGRLFRAAEKISLECKLERTRDKIILRPVEFVWMLFADAVGHDYLVIKLNSLELRVFLRYVYVVIEEHHEIRRDLVDVRLVLCENGKIETNVYRYGRQVLVISIGLTYFIFYFVVQAVKPVALPLISGAGERYHRQFVALLPIVVLQTFHDTGPCRVYAWNLKP